MSLMGMLTNRANAVQPQTSKMAPQQPMPTNSVMGPSYQPVIQNSPHLGGGSMGQATGGALGQRMQQATGPTQSPGQMSNTAIGEVQARQYQPPQPNTSQINQMAGDQFNNQLMGHMLSQQQNASGGYSPGVYAQGYGGGFSMMPRENTGIRPAGQWQQNIRSYF